MKQDYEIVTTDFSTAKAQRDVIAARLQEADLVGNTTLAEKPLGSAQYFLKVAFIKAVADQDLPKIPEITHDSPCTVILSQPRNNTDFTAEI